MPHEQNISAVKFSAPPARRVSKSGGSSKLYWYGSGGDILAETDTSGNTTAEYIFFGGKRIAMIPSTGIPPLAGNPIYYVEDLLGTSRVITTNTGVVCYDADFYPFGGERAYTNTCPQNYKFEGKERDSETGNDDFGARYYSNRFGRWLSADWSSIPVPVPYANLANPQTLNLYSMVSDDPESFADLDGHMQAQTYQVANPAASAAWDPGGIVNDMTNDSGYTDEEVDSLNAFRAAQPAAQQAQAFQQMQAAVVPNTSQTPLGAETLSSRGLDFIARHETMGGEPNLTVYDDIQGHATIGYGHLVRPNEDFSKGITKEQARALLAQDVESTVAFVNKHNHFSLSQVRFDALVSVAYNSQRAALTIMRAMDKHRQITTNTFIRSLRPNMRHELGLVNRRQDEANLFLHHRYD